MHQIMPNLVWGEDNYFRIDRHYLDEGQFGAVPIDSPLNYKRGYGGGVENTMTYNLPNLALRLNVFVAREEDIEVASGQYNFSPAEVAYLNEHYFVLDHTPLVGGSGGATTCSPWMDSSAAGCGADSRTSNNCQRSGSST